MGLAVFWDILGWLVPLVMLPVVARRHTPGASLAWLILIFFSPWLGLVLYLLIGENIVMRRSTKCYCERIREVRALDRLSRQDRMLHSRPDAGRCLWLAHLTEPFTCMPIIDNNGVEFLDDGRTVIERLVADIENACDHVHLLFYIFNDDEVGRRVAEAMVKAVERGVRCRLLVDAFGSRGMMRSMANRLMDHGIEFHALMPANPFRRHLSRFDLRNHRKLAIIDGRIAYTGSQNIEHKDYDNGRAEAWHDLMVRVTGPAVLKLQLVFCEDWYLASEVFLEDNGLFPEPDLGGTAAIRVMPSGPDDPSTTLRDLMIAVIFGARERIIMTSPYFIPDEPFLVALHLAALRGVQVDLIIPRTADHVIVGAVARAHFERLIKSGVMIHLHRGLLHSKTMSVDETLGIIGTANFDHRSFFLHAELSLLLYGSDATWGLRSKQVHYIDQSESLDPVRWRERSRLLRSRDEILKLLSPLL